MRIKSVKARQVINAKGHPTLEVEVSTEKNTAFSSVPLAASKSKYEYYDVFDHDLQRFDGRTLNTVIENIHRTVVPELIGQRSMDQEDLDALLLQIDNSYDRSRLGVNAITALSQSLAKLGALESDLPLFKYIRVLHDFSEHNLDKLQSDYSLPIPVITIFKSTNHDKSADLPLQEVMVLPRNKFSYSSDIISLFDNIDSLELSAHNHTLKSYLDNLNSQISHSKMKLDLGIDVAAARFKREDHADYVMNNLNTRRIAFKGSYHKLLLVYLNLVKDHNVIFLEDLFDEDEYGGWNELLNQSTKINKKVQIVSDDFTASNIERLEKIALLESSNNVVIKPSQVGTVSEVIHYAARARKHGLNTTVSYRFGDTEETFISDLAVGIGANYIRTGYFQGSENNSKINRLIQIEHSL